MRQPERDGPAAAPAVIAAQGAGPREELAVLGLPAGDELQASPPPGKEPMQGLSRLVRFARRHALFGALLLIAGAVRLIVMLGFPGAMLFGDSQAYVSVAMHMRPGDGAVVLRPSGYPGMLVLLSPLHSVVAVVAAQHVMGLGVGVAGYALLRRRGLPGWGATLAMVPVLLSAYAIQLEHFILSDSLFGFLVMLAVVVLMWRPDPPLWAYWAAGLLLGLSALVRSQGLPLMLVFVAVLLCRLRDWRTFAGVVGLCAAFAIPVAGYATWFKTNYGVFNLTRSDGIFLWARVTTFADCAKIKPPPAERPLCMNVPVSQRVYAPDYLWNPSPIQNIKGGEFGTRADKLGTDFALRAIRAQPLAYASAVWNSFAQTFMLHETATSGPFQHAGPAESSLLQGAYAFPAKSPPPQVPADVPYFRAYDPASLHLRIVQPFASWTRAYQRYVVVAGPLLGLIALAGLAGALIAWRRLGWPVLLPWLSGVVLLATPALTAEFDTRYVVCAVPPLCVAAAMSVPLLADLAKRLREKHGGVASARRGTA